MQSFTEYTLGLSLQISETQQSTVFQIVNCSQSSEPDSEWTLHANTLEFACNSTHSINGVIAFFQLLLVSTKRTTCRSDRSILLWMQNDDDAKVHMSKFPHYIMSLTSPPFYKTIWLQFFEREKLNYIQHRFFWQFSPELFCTLF